MEESSAAGMGGDRGTSEEPPPSSSSAGDGAEGTASEGSASSLLASAGGTTSTIGRRPLGTLTALLPEGTVLRCEDATSAEGAEASSSSLSAIVKPGESLLALLHGRGAQTLLLNAFCGQPKRRMYARLKWSVFIF
jgi:hypothetical protein